MERVNLNKTPPVRYTPPCVHNKYAQCMASKVTFFAKGRHLVL